MTLQILINNNNTSKNLGFSIKLNIRMPYQNFEEKILQIKKKMYTSATKSVTV